MKIPKKGLTVGDATLIRWYKKEGEKVKKGESLFEFETLKAITVVEAPCSGVVKKISVQEGETVSVSTVVASLDCDRV